MAKFKTLFLAEKDSQVVALSHVLKANYTKKWHPAYNLNERIAIIPLRGHLLQNLEPQEYNEEWGKFGEQSIYIFPDQQKLKPSLANKEIFDRAIAHIKEAEKIIIATDFDNEGAAIAMNTIKWAGCENKVERMLHMGSTHPIELKKAIDNPIEINFRNMAFSANARSFIDWAEGMSLSRALTYYLGGRGRVKLNFGGVKTPIIYIVVQRDLAFESHQVSYYYTATGKIRRGNDLIEVTLKHKVKDEKTGKESWSASFDSPREIEQAIEVLSKTPLKIGDVKRRDSKNSPPKLYELAGLQGEMSKSHGVDLMGTMNIAQKLYDHPVSLQTYPRTDIPYLKEAEYVDVKPILTKLRDHNVISKEIIDEIFKGDIPKRKSTFDDSKVVAHGAIVPTLSGDLGAWLPQLQPKERTCFDLVAKRYTANFMDDYEYVQVTGNTEEVNGYILAFTEQIPTKAGWKKIYEKDIENKIATYEPTIPSDLRVGEPVSLETLESKKNETKPKPRFTESTLLAAIENVANLFPENEEIKEFLGEHGIGTNATRAIIIKQLFDVEFNKGQPWLVYEGKNIISTQKARDLVAILPEALVSPIKRAVLSKELKEIECGRKKYETVVDEYRADVQKNIDIIKTTAENGGKMAEGANERVSLGKCPKCGKGDIEERGGVFMCSNSQTRKEGDKFVTVGCDFKIFKTGLQKLGKQELTAKEIKALLDKKGIMITLKGEYGPYKAKLVLDMTFGTKVIFEKAGEKEYKILGKCPFCGGNVLIKDKTFECENKKMSKDPSGAWINNGSCNFTIFKTALERFGKPKLAESEVRKLLKEGSLGVDLVSQKTRKGFSATIEPNEQYGIKINFPSM